MNDDWAAYCSEIDNKSPELTAPPPKLNGHSHEGFAVSALSRLKSASINDHIEEMKERLAKERDVVPGMITTGTVTLVYAPPGAGKTVWILGSLFQSIRNNLIKGSDVIYFNEDDGVKGIIQKGEMGRLHGMTMVSLALSKDPSLRTTDDALRLLNAIREEGEADGKIVICDTLKKFAPVLNKGDMREVLHVFREFAAAGGTVILLGHCNKHRSMDGRLIYEGVGDLKSDVDNMFGLDPVNDKYAPYQELLVINEKDRSQISFEGGFKYKQTSEVVNYKQSVDSVEFMSPDDISELKTKQAQQINIAKAQSKYEDEYYFLSDVMWNSGKTWTMRQLKDLLRDEEINPNECTYKKLRSCIELLRGNNIKVIRSAAHGAKIFEWQEM